MVCIFQERGVLAQAITRQLKVCVINDLYDSLYRFSGTLCCGGPSRKGLSGDRPCTKWVSLALLFFSQMWAKISQLTYL